MSDEQRRSLTNVTSRWSPIVDTLLLYQLPPYFDTVPHLRTLMGHRIETIGAHGSQTLCEPEDSVHGAGHRRRGPGLVSLALRAGCVGAAC
jgi:hypothetical protein